MQAKVDAIVNYVEAVPNATGVIGDLTLALESLAGKAGTQVVKTRHSLSQGNLEAAS